MIRRHSAKSLIFVAAHSASVKMVAEFSRRHSLKHWSENLKEGIVQCVQKHTFLLLYENLIQFARHSRILYSVKMYMHFTVVN